MNRSMFTAAGVAAVMFGIVSAGVVVGGGFFYGHLMFMAIAFIGIAFGLGRLTAREEDRRWLPSIMVLGVVAKLAGSWVRHLILFGVYGGVGDAIGYHGGGIRAAQVWRSFNIPDMATVTVGGEGTRFVTWLTGLFYAPYEPSTLGGFWIFSFLAFLGQYLCYLGFRKAIPSGSWKRYAILIFFWPTLLYWPSSLGKEALLTFFLGIGAWAAAGLFQHYKLFWLVPVGAAAWLTSLVRVHVAAIFAGGVLVTVLFAKGSKDARVALRRVITLALAVAAMIPIGLALGDEFGVNLDSSFNVQELDPVFADVGDTTGQGGSAVAGGVIRSPADIPSGVLKVLFRPLPNEARNAQTLAASAEGMLLLLLVIWRLPTMISNAGQLRRTPFLLFCATYSALFIWAWSAILNLGIIARQRSIVIPFVLATIAGIGWKLSADDDHDEPALTPPVQNQGPS